MEGQVLDRSRVESLLRAAGSDLTMPDLVDLVAGVAAAPPGADPDAWMALVVPRPSDDLKRCLSQLLEDLIGNERSDRDRGAHSKRLAALRAELAKRGLDGFAVPRADEHQGEWVPRHADRLSWLTGFSGSAGVAIVLRDSAAIFVDGRYTLQVEAEVDTDAISPLHISEHPPATWVGEVLRKGQKLGYDPWLHTASGTKRLREACARVGAELIACADNPIDAIWTDQPPAPISPVVVHEARFAGRSSAEKKAEIAESLRKAGQGAAVLSAPDSIAWLLNLRGGDVAHTPLALGFGIVTDEGRVTLFMDQRKLTTSARSHLGNAVEVKQPAAFAEDLGKLGEHTVRVDEATGPEWVVGKLRDIGATVVLGDDPCALPKACKNSVEVDGARAAHRRDGVAVTRFLAWLAREAPSSAVTELSAARKLEALRREGRLIRDLSFPTISGSGPNGAIVHYRVTERTDRALGSGELYLVDSGAQYLDGTTDITRTVLIGTPDHSMVAEHRDRFTRVLKGHIGIATARFPTGVAGSQLDVLARRPLWEIGADFDHGTGHGVGSYLGVHEGPHRISKAGGGTALREGMIVSNEPGYYKNGAYGIRIENLVCVVPCPDIPGAERSMLGFETLTLAPIDRALVDTALLSSGEEEWLNAYHKQVRETIGPDVDPETATWLEKATKPL